jgi:ATP-binding cassette subfamily B protein
MDLALPDLMSKIVTVGIQHGGIVTPVPEALRASELDRLELFMDSSEIAAIEAAYDRQPVDEGGSSPLAHRYPAIRKEAIAVRAVPEGDSLTSLEKTMAEAAAVVSSIRSAATVGIESAPLAIGRPLDASEGGDPFAAIGALGEASRLAIREKAVRAIGASGEGALERVAIQAALAEYERLGMDRAAPQTGYIVWTGFLMLLLTLASAAATVAVGYLGARTAAGAARDLRRDVFAKIEGFSSAEFERFSTASLITRSTNDVMQLQTVTALMLRLAIYAPIIGVGGFFRALDKAPAMSWIIGVALVALLGFVATVILVAMPKFKSMQRLADKLNLVIRENLSGLAVVRAFGRESFEERRFEAANTEVTGVNLFVARVMSSTMPAIMLLMNALGVAIIWVGSRQIAESAMNVGDMMAFLQYAMQIVMSFLMLSMIFIFLPRASVSGSRIAEVLSAEASIRDPETPRPLPFPAIGRVEFRNVSFRYPGADGDAVSDVCFVANPGETTAIIGPTGSGKSTLLNLIVRFFDVSSGSIEVDDVDVREVRQAQLRERIGYVPQRSILFSGTVASNLRFGDEGASDDRILASCDAAQAAEFLDSREGGLSAPISQGGINVSGGQRQRLSIARALVKGYPIYLFDDCFSALDYTTDAALRASLKERAPESAFIMVAQRVATVMRAERIIVLDEGRVVGSGTHRELLASCPQYREIAASQLGEEALS